MPRVCQVCKLPAELRAEVEDLHRREVPLRAIADELRSRGTPVHRDTIWRHCRDHVVAPETYAPEGPSSPAALMVAAVAAEQLKHYSGTIASLAAALRAEGLDGPAAVVSAQLPGQMQAGLTASATTPASVYIEAVVLVDVLTDYLVGEADPAFLRAAATAFRERGAPDLAEAFEAHLPPVEPAPIDPATATVTELRSRLVH